MCGMWNLAFLFHSPLNSEFLHFFVDWMFIRTFYRPPLCLNSSSIQGVQMTHSKVFWKVQAPGFQKSMGLWGVRSTRFLSGFVQKRQPTASRQAGVEGAKV